VLGPAPARRGRPGRGPDVRARQPDRRRDAVSHPPRTRRRRRPAPRSDWQFPLLTELGLRPDQQKLLVVSVSVVGVLAASVALVLVILSLGSYTAPARTGAAIAQTG